MLRRVEEYIRKNNMINSGDHIVVGVSGGADSICLLDILYRLTKKLDFRLTAVHINHMIRGAEADADEAYVKRLCKNYDIELLCEHIDVPKRAMERGESLEEAGRRARYDCFESVDGVTKIAVAHHADDQAETVLHNIVRGSSIRGAGGIRPVRGMIIRPLLCMRRSEIEQYLAQKDIAFCIDSTNLSMDYTRNKLRGVVIPYLSENINSDAVENINELAGDLAECYEYIKEQAKELYYQCVRQSESRIWLNVAGLKGAPALIRREVIMMTIEQLTGSVKDITRKHINSVDDLLFKEVSKKVDLPYEMVVLRDYTELEFRLSSVDLNDAQEAMPEISMVVEKFDGDWKKLTNDYTKVFDYDKIKGGLKLRKRMPGDYIVLNDAGNKKTLKAYFIDEKIPREQRDKMWLLAEGNHILWIIGHRISSAYKTGNRTKRALIITLRRNEYDI